MQDAKRAVRDTNLREARAIKLSADKAARDLIARSKIGRRPVKRTLKAKMLRVPKFTALRDIRADGMVSPWIKLHPRWLDDYNFSILPDHLKLQLVLLWLFASRSGNLIPNDPDFLTWRLATDMAVDLEALVARGFLEPAPEDVQAEDLRGTSEEMETAARMDDPGAPRARPARPGAVENLGETRAPEPEYLPPDGTDGEKAQRLRDADEAAALVRRFRINRDADL